MSRDFRVLRIDSSGRTNESSTRALTDNLVGVLQNLHRDAEVVRRDLTFGVPFVNQDWIDANFTSAEDRTDTQKETLAYSDGLVAELKAADAIVIGLPIYNFGVPASLKAWVDMIVRARLTFRYGDDGPVGLLQGKKAYVVVASDGVSVDSEYDLATPYIRQALRFVGINDIEVIAADQQATRGDEALDAARLQIAELFHVTSSTAREQAAI